ncbi:hypothetical protein D770_02775 [Flammeovirgaceae bacterium 311]|nr:hypothetical protein D770_02775 [Flammeovirgaceae bacterium 311]
MKKRICLYSLGEKERSQSRRFNAWLVALYKAEGSSGKLSAFWMTEGCEGCGIIYNQYLGNQIELM